MEEKIALITGGSSDIGIAIAKKLHEEGYSIILTSRTEPKGLAFPFIYIPTDLTKEQDIDELITKIEKVDVLVNVAGIWHNDTDVFADKEYFDFDWETILSTMQVGIIAPMKLIYGLKEKFTRDSNIINITGTFEDGGKGWVPYYVSKKALEELTYALADDLKERNIYVNAVSPSDTATRAYEKFFPQYMDEAIDPSKVADMVFNIIKGKRNRRIEVVD